ncbi:hypothetical protein NA57DRAFT_47258 [Rhizodiscina lignyota]|uniref:DUF1275 domain protein n=1 Tax=Rhizodiscina lignyota TaxID=1504668 RepID=A0A9P4I399_9PEZI|nr:hypothetical protein NA57DRAFT_47258 [Rhizodiscina lignyota]
MASAGSGYGSIARTGNGQPQRPSDEESSPLLGRPKDSEPSYAKRFHRHMTRDISTRRGDLLLLVCYVITGLLDSSSISIWGSFVSMQTGNTVYIGLGLSDPFGGTRWLKALTSLGFFCMASFIFARYHRFFSPRKRWVLFSSFVFQLFCIIGAALIITLEKTDTDAPGGELRWQILVPIAMVAFQAGGQAVTSRALKFNALTSVVLTSIYCDLFSDAKLFAAPTQNVERNQRMAAPICVLIGAIGGGLWSQSEVGIAGALWTAAILKVFLVIAWLLWKSEKEED